MLLHYGPFDHSCPPTTILRPLSLDYSSQTIVACRLQSSDYHCLIMILKQPLPNMIPPNLHHLIAASPTFVAHLLRSSYHCHPTTVLGSLSPNYGPHTTISCQLRSQITIFLLQSSEHRHWLWFSDHHLRLQSPHIHYSTIVLPTFVACQLWSLDQHCLTKILWPSSPNYSVFEYNLC